MAVPVAGGPARTAVDCVRPWGFAVSAPGIYYLGCQGGNDSVPVYLRSPATGRDALVAKLDKVFPAGFTVSQDGKTMLYPRLEREGSDLVLIENFR